MSSIFFIPNRKEKIIVTDREKFFNTKKILLDCKNEKIIILEKSTYDEDIEVEKTLKSIGYIK